MPTPTVSPLAGSAVGPAIDRIEAAIRSVNAPLDDMGMQLLGVLAVIALIWQGGKWMFADNMTEVLGGVLRTIFLFALTFFLMQPAAGGGNRIVNFSSSLVADAAQRIAGAGGLKAVVVGGVDSIGQLSNGISKSMTSLTERETTWWGKISVYIDSAPSILILWGAQLMLLAAASILFVVGVAGLVLTQVSVIVAPLFIPWMVLPVTSWLWDGWLKFSVGAVLYSLAAPALLRVAVGLLSTVSMPPASGRPEDFGLTIASATLVLMVSVTVAWIAAQVPAIATGLASGSAGVGMGGSLGAGMGAAGGAARGAAAGIQGARGAGRSIRNFIN